MEGEKKKKGKIGRITMMGRQKKKKMIPQELQIQKMIQPTYGIVTISQSRSNASNEKVTADCIKLIASS